MVQEYQRCISDALAKSNQTADKEEDKPQVHHTLPYSAIKGCGSGLMKLKLKKSFCTNVSDWSRDGKFQLSDILCLLLLTIPVAYSTHLPDTLHLPTRTVHTGTLLCPSTHLPISFRPTYRCQQYLHSSIIAKNRYYFCFYISPLDASRYFLDVCL